MEIFSQRLKQRTHDLGLSDAEVARRAGLSERRYNHYAKGVREPDLATLVRICEVLGVTPDSLLLHRRDASEESGRVLALTRVQMAAAALDMEDLELAAHQLEGFLAFRAARTGAPADTSNCGTPENPLHPGATPRPEDPLK